jgi:hypothetical protein
MKDLLLLLCQYPFDIKNRERLGKLLGEVPDWNKLVKLINAHGIIALAAYNIKKANLEKLVPSDALTILENGLIQSMVRNSWLTERWKEVYKILSDAGIKHILLKGMALEHTLYGASGLRQMNDNDIYIKPEDSIKAWNLLQKNGFEPEPLKSPLFKKIMFDFGRHLPALYKDGYTLEIHSSLFENQANSRKESDDPFLEALEISIGNSRALILSGELQLKHLIHHFEHHKAGGECQLRLYNDIVLLDYKGKIQYPDRFVEDPIQSYKTEFRRTAYRRTVLTVPARYRFRFITGDTFPALKWMKMRYKCSVVSAIIRYPSRIGKWWWLF